MSLRVLIADDHDMVLRGVELTIEASGVGRVVGRAGSTDELMSLLATHPCDLLVTDLLMPGGSQTDGYLMIEKIRRDHPNLPVVVLSMTGNLATLRMVLKTGVLGILDKNSSRAVLELAIAAAAEGKPYLSANITQMFADAEVVDGALAGKPLSERENVVLELMQRGMSVSDIAKQLRRSITTISKQKNSAMRRLGLKTDQDLYDYLRNLSRPVSLDKDR